MEDTDAGMVRDSETTHDDGLVEELDACRSALVAAQERHAHCNEHLSLFAGQVSHDLRTPLTAILANAEMLSGEIAVTEDADLGWMVDGINRAAHRMNTMIEQMLDYAREGGAPRLRTTSLTAVFELALDDLASVVADKQAEVTLAKLPTLAADPDQLYDVALNLLSNALKFARPETPPRVEVSADRIGDRWRVSVTDDGIGVDPERQESMFVLFTRADKRVEGSGIGLANAKRVVESHGGRIGMDSEPGRGTTVWFELPA